MKIGAQIKVFNFVMRERRLACGWSQTDLASQCEVPAGFIGEVETLRCPQVSISKLIARLNKIAEVLELPFEEVFPADYLEALEHNRLPHSRQPIVWCKEIRLDELPPDHDLFQLPSSEETLLTEELEAKRPIVIRTQLDRLSDAEREVIQLRYGLDCAEGEGLTLREIAARRGVSVERVRQIEAKALKHLRHPRVSRKLRKYYQ